MRSPDSECGSILIADDEPANRDLLTRRLERDGHRVIAVADGELALAVLKSQPIDLVMLDVCMPRLAGPQLLQMIRSDQMLRHLGVLMISAVDDPDSVAECIRMGADDFIPKPFNTVVLRARVNALLERKRLQDRELRQVREIERQRSIAQSLLRNILPDKVALELATRGSVEPVYFPDATIGFTDFVGFTLSAEELVAADLVEVLNLYFTAFDDITSRYGLEKLKTIGDSYMFAAGLPEPNPAHAVDAILAAHEIVHFVQHQTVECVPVNWQVRVGIHTGPVIAGVVGKTKFAYDVWGDAVNLAARMESSGAPNRVNISSGTFARAKDFFQCERRGRIQTKDGRQVDMFFADSIRDDDPASFGRRYERYFNRGPRQMPSFWKEKESQSQCANHSAG